MAQEQGQRWVKFDAAGSISGVYMITGFFIDAPTQTVRLTSPWSTTTVSLIKATSFTGGFGGLDLKVQGNIVASTIGSGAEVYVYFK
ncbi:MAG: hypothetical protein ACXABY_28060 [Candidatus Thorarchaeota archaeon]|jgi:hypothetical protein